VRLIEHRVRQNRRVSLDPRWIYGHSLTTFETPFMITRFLVFYYHLLPYCRTVGLSWYPAHLDLLLGFSVLYVTIIEMTTSDDVFIVSCSTGSSPGLSLKSCRTPKRLDLVMDIDLLLSLLWVCTPTPILMSILSLLHTLELVVMIWQYGNLVHLWFICTVWWMYAQRHYGG
jgi:hypothetical protein